MTKRKPLNLAQAAYRYADAVIKRMSSQDTPVADVKLELAMAYMCGAIEAKKPPQDVGP